MEQTPMPPGVAPLRPVLAWAWRPGPRDGELGAVHARVHHLATNGAEALVMAALEPGSEAFRSVRQVASGLRLQVIEARADRAVHLEPGMSELRLEEMARDGAERTDLDAIVCDGPEEGAAALLANAKRLRRQIDRLAWQRLH